MDHHKDLPGNLKYFWTSKSNILHVKCINIPKKNMFLGIYVWPDIQALNKRITEMKVQKLVFPVLASSIERKLQSNLPIFICNSQGSSSCGMDVAAHHSFIQSNILLISVSFMFSAHVH